MKLELQGEIWKSKHEYVPYYTLYIYDIFIRYLEYYFSIFKGDAFSSL